MKKYIHSISFIAASLLGGFLLQGTGVKAQVTENYIVVSGQVTNNEFGNVVKNHKVYFLRDSTVTVDSGPNLTEVVTDDEGFYYDTIRTRTSKGSLKIYTSDYFGLTIDTLKYYRFVTYTASNFIITNFDIFMPIQADVLQSKFSYMQKQNDNSYRYRFVDETEYDSINSWHWSFGDGTTSDEQFPHHTFPGPGMYKIRLTTTAMLEGIQQSNTMLRVIYIADRSFFHLGGHAYVGYFPANECLAYLYYIDEEEFKIPVDTISVDTLGFYGFWQVPSGNYFIKVQPKKTSEYYGAMLPTYYGDVIFWEEASQIDHKDTYWGYHIRFVEGAGIDTGEGEISGNVKYIDILDGNDYNLPAKGIDIFVFDEDEQTLISHYSDHNGQFEFPEVALGTYWLFPEVTGLNQKKIKVEVTPEEPVVANIEIILTPGDVDSLDYINDYVSENMLGLPYPNPATDIVHFEIQSDNYKEVTFDIFDLQGRILLTRQTQLQGGSNTMTIKTENLKSGVFIVRSNVEGQISERRFLISR